MKYALIAVALLTAGCHHSGTSETATPRAPTTVKVENRNTTDMDVFVLQQGLRHRLGMVTGGSTKTFTIPEAIVNFSPQVQFEVHPIGGQGNPRSMTVTVKPGDQIELTIPSYM